MQAEQKRVLFRILDRLPTTAVCGIAQRRAARLTCHGIRSCLDLALADRLLFRALLTRVGEATWYELNGERLQPPLGRRAGQGDGPRVPDLVVEAPQLLEVPQARAAGQRAGFFRPEPLPLQAQVGHAAEVRRGANVGQRRPGV